MTTFFSDTHLKLFSESFHHWRTALKFFGVLLLNGSGIVLLPSLSGSHKRKNRMGQDRAGHPRSPRNKITSPGNIKLLKRSLFFLPYEP